MCLIQIFRYRSLLPSLFLLSLTGNESCFSNWLIHYTAYDIKGDKTTVTVDQHKPCCVLVLDNLDCSHCLDSLENMVGKDSHLIVFYARAQNIIVKRKMINYFKNRNPSWEVYFVDDVSQFTKKQETGIMLFYSLKTGHEKMVDLAKGSCVR